MQKTTPNNTHICDLLFKVRVSNGFVGSGLAAHTSLAAKILRIPHIAAKIPQPIVLMDLLDDTFGWATLATFIVCFTFIPRLRYPTGNMI